MEVEMRAYEEQVDQTILEMESRKENNLTREIFLGMLTLHGNNDCKWRVVVFIISLNCSKVCRDYRRRLCGSCKEGMLRRQGGAWQMVFQNNEHCHWVIRLAVSQFLPIFLEAGWWHWGRGGEYLCDFDSKNRSCERNWTGNPQHGT